MKKLTEKQNKVYEALKKFINDNGYPPTTAELKSSLGYSSENSIVEHLSLIEKKGYIKRTPNIARSIVVL